MTNDTVHFSVRVTPLQSRRLILSPGAVGCKAVLACGLKFLKSYSLIGKFSAKCFSRNRTR